MQAQWARQSCLHKLIYLDLISLKLSLFDSFKPSVTLAIK
jgi:hypothetical protein